MDEDDEYEEFINNTRNQLAHDDIDLIREFVEQAGVGHEHDELLARLLVQIQVCMLHVYVSGYHNGHRPCGEHLYADTIETVSHASVIALSGVVDILSDGDDDEEAMERVVREGDVLDASTLTDEQAKVLSKKMGIPFEVLRSGKVGIVVPKGVTMERLLSDDTMLVAKECQVRRGGDSPDGWDIEEETD